MVGFFYDPKLRWPTCLFGYFTILHGRFEMANAFKMTSNISNIL